MSERKMTSPAVRPLRRVLAPVLTAALVLFAAAPAQANIIPYTLVITDDGTGDMFVGSFSIDDANIALGGGPLLSFDIATNLDSWSLSDPLDFVIRSEFVSSDMVSVTGLDVSIRDGGMTGPGIRFFTTGDYTGTEGPGIYTFSAVAVTVPEPGTFGLMGGGLVALGLCAVRRRREAAATR